MRDETGPVLWALVLVPLVLVLGTTLRWVPSGHWLVGIRGGRVCRTHGPGPAFRVPVLERTVLLSSHPEPVPVAARGTSRDSRTVRVLAEATFGARPPDLGAPFREPGRAEGDALEELLSREVAAHDVDQLPEGLVAWVTHLCDEADRTTRTVGAPLLGLEIVEIDVLITPAEAPRGPR